MTHRLMVRAAGVLALVCTGGCGMSVRGDFDGVPFTPDSTLLAAVDRHDMLVRNGAVVPVLKNEVGQSLDLLLTAARLDVEKDWRRMSAQSLLELQRELATSDGLLLTRIPLAAFERGETMTAVVERGLARGDFHVALGAERPSESVIAEQGLGSKVRVILSPRGLDARVRGGSLSAEIEIQREREAGQDGDIATGNVLLSFSTSLQPERLAESNLTVAAPILECMQELGPFRGAACKDEEPLPYVDETGPVR